MWRHWNKLDLILVVLLIATLAAYFLFPGLAFKIFLWTFIILAVVRIFFLLRKKLLWKISHRLLFSGLFFIATPILLISIFFFFVVNIIIAQYGVSILDNLMDTQLVQVQEVADIYLGAKDPEQMVKMVEQPVKYDPGYLNVLLFEKKNGQWQPFFKYPADFDDSKLLPVDFKGFFMNGQNLYHGVWAQKEAFAVLLAFTVNQKFLDRLSTINDFYIRYRHPYSSGRELTTEITSDNNFMNNKSLLYPYIFEYSYLDLNAPTKPGPVKKAGTFLLAIDYGKIYQKIKNTNAGSTQNTTRKIIYVLIAVFSTFIITSFIIGFRMILVITRSLDQITKGTQRIRNGDFSYRIRIKSKDQLQYLGDSFNEMAAGIDRLLVEEKERQRLQEELRIARSIQLKLLPPEEFASEEFEIAAVNIPAEEIAGDYFDYFYRENEYLSILVADVAGKGASAAFYMAELKGLFNYLLKKDMSPANWIGECHASLCTSLDRSTFITISIAKLIIPKKKFILARAGHTQGVFYNAREKKCHELFPHGMAIGLRNFSIQGLEETELAYGAGDILFLFSDGLSEILNKDDEVIGVSSLKQIICQNAHLSAREIKEKILEFSIRFSGEKRNLDDLTFVLLKVKC